ncbi:hypothetical protein V6N13_033405 [Hibiscus sabdariffa]
MGISLVSASPICYDTGNFTTISTYGKNRDLILASLPPNASAKERRPFMGGDPLCLVRYANRSFYGILELDPVEAGYNTGDITSNLTEFGRV